MSPQEDVQRQLRTAPSYYNLYRRSPQAAGVFADPDEVKAHRWFLVRPPIAWFHDGGDHGGGLLRATLWVKRVEADSREVERVREVAEWIRSTYGGDLNKALMANPLLAFDNGHLVDGWHRLYIWMKRVSAEVGPPTLVGVER